MNKATIYDYKDIESLIPHRGKMLLLSRIISFDLKGNLRAEYDINENCIYYDPAIAGVPVWAGFEFMAQAISALSGIKDREMGIKPKIGFILSVSSMIIHIPVFPCNSSVQINISQYDLTDRIYTFNGEVYLENKKAIEGKLMVIELKDEQELENLLKVR